MPNAEPHDTIQRLRELVASSSNIVFFGGAGVSTQTVPLVPIFLKTEDFIC